MNLCLLCFVGGIIGARLYFVALNLNFYLVHPEEILATWLGGLSIHGGLIGGLLVGVSYAQWKRLPKLAYADVIGCTLPLAQAIGRWGNFFNSEAFGKPCLSNFPIQVKIPLSSRPAAYRADEYFQPTFLYESLWNFLVFLLLYYVLSDRLKDYPGLSFLAYLALYSIGRLLVEPLRTDSIMFGAMPVPVIASVVLLVASIILAPLLVLWHKSRQRSLAE